MNIFEELTGKIKGTNKRIVFPEGEDKRVLGACVRLKKDGLVTPIVLGNVEEIKKTAKELNVCIDDIEIIDPLKAEDFDELVEIQKNILETGSSYLRPGGRLIYSTCTINPRENEIMIKKFLEMHEEFISEKEVKLSPFDNGYDGFYMNKLKKLEGRCPNGCGV